ncbi:MAG: SIS domain-containing protein [Lentisphaerota bacterium]
MSRNQWSEHIDELTDLLKASAFRGRAGVSMDVEKGFDLWKRMTLKLRNNKGTIYLIGNGASASMASHFAADLAKNARLHTEVFSDLSLITAISNDMGYEHIFSEPISRRVKPGDMLVAISSSGRSPNVLSAVRAAQKKKAVIVTLSAMKPGNPLRSLGALNIYVPAQTYGFAESCHAALLHHWMDMVEMA